MNLESAPFRALAFAILLSTAGASAADPHGRPPRDAVYGSAHWQLDGRFHHDRYYPARGYVVAILPPGYIDVAFGGTRYSFHAGVWFRPHGSRWIVTAPPLGIIIPVLPIGYTTLWVRGLPYYYADDVYYTRVPSGYQVVDAPPPEEVTLQDASANVVSTTQPPPVAAPPAPGAPVSNAPVPTYARGAAVVTSSAPPTSAAPDGLFVYPRNKQSETQTAFDRIECVKWAIGQTGFDPSQVSGDAAARSNFQRAASACLDARGYSVK
jgi:hypothetical protein